MRYLPRAVVIGAAISAAAFAGLLIALLITVIRDKKMSKSAN
jgi:hypothetical protein